MTEPRPFVAGYTPLLPPAAAPAQSSLHPPLEGCDPVALAEQAYGKHSRQSSAVAEPFSGWMFATEAEVAPWWEIDLGPSVLVERIALWLAPMPKDVVVSVAAHALHSPQGQPLAASFQSRALAGDLPVASDGSSVLWVTADAVARYVRVTLHGAGGEPVTLLLRGAQIQAARLFGETLLASYQRAFTLFADGPIFAARACPGTGPFTVTHRYREVWAEARRLAAALGAVVEAGCAGERVFLGLCTNNRPEWVMMDLAAVMRGYVVVPLSPDDSDERLAGILSRCPLHAVLASGSGAPRFVRLAERCPTLRWIVTCEPHPSGEGEREPSPGQPAIVGFADLVARATGDLAGDGASPSVDSRGAALVAPVAKPRDPRDLYTLVFTSGSTGVPRGAMRSHATFLAMVESYFVAQPAVHLSFQPLCHLSERMYLPAVVMNGGLIGFSGGGAHLLSDLRELEPSLVGSVPRLFEVVHAAHRRKVEAARAAEPDAPPDEIEARVLRESRAVFGARVQSLGVGSAPCSPEVMAFLRRCFADIWVTDGYGTSEHGTIAGDGRIQSHVEVKLVAVPGMAEGEAERGEIWVRTPHVIDGYYGDPEATAANIDAEGFFRTGDLGERTDGGGVRVVGRVKNVLKLGQGEFVAVDRIETELVGCPLVDQIFVHPDTSYSGLLAVVVPRADPLGGALGTPDRPLHELSAHPDAARVIARALAEHGRRAGLASFELPRAVLVEAEPFTAASGLLTASGKLARPVAIGHYAARLAALERSAPPDAVPAEGSLAARLAAVASGVVGRRVDPGEPLHQGLGVDSLAVAEVLAAAAGTLGREIPLGLWFESRTLDDLAHRLDSGLLGRGAPKGDLPQRDLDLDPWPGAAEGPGASGVGHAREGGSRAGAELAAPRVPFETVLLTGATGFLGAHLLESLAARTGAHVICLVRAPSGEAAAERVRETLARYAIPGLAPGRWTAVSGDLAAPGLGLPEGRFRELAGQADAILHAGAVVHWLAPYEALRAPNVLGTLELLRLAMTARRKPFHFVSTISTAPPDGDESSRLSLPQARAGGGYGLAKWVAEQLVSRAAERGHPAAIYRPAMITGHSRRGLGNPDDYVHRYLRACVQSGSYLDAPGERLDMTPVDFVADGIVALLQARPLGGATHHLSNLDRSMTYAELGRAIAGAGFPCVPVRYPEYRAAVVGAPTSPLRPLASYFPEGGFSLHMGPWPSARSRESLAALGVVCPPADGSLVALYLAGLAQRGFVAR